MGKWKVPILWKLTERKNIRFQELKRELNGITNLVLTKCLKELEAAHIVKRVQYEQIPPCVEYSLTEEGKKLVKLLDGLHKFGKELLAAYPRESE